MSKRVALALAVCLTSGCVKYARADADSAGVAIVEGRFEPLWQRDLSAFEQRIAIERHAGVTDDWTAVSQAWLDLVNCNDVAEEPKLQDPLAAWMHAVVRAEALRRALAIFRSTTRVRQDAQALYIDAAVPEFFARDAAERSTELIEWPLEREGWVDEVPARQDVPSNCSTLRERVLDTRMRDDDNDSPRRGFQDWLKVYFEAVRAADQAFASVPEHARVGAPALLAWRSRLWVATLSHDTAVHWDAFAEAALLRAQGGVDAEANLARATSARKRAAELRAVARDVVAAVVATPAPGAADEELARARLLLASYVLDAGDTEQAIRLLAKAREGGLDAENFWAARYLELRVASDAADWATAAALADGLPPQTSPYHGAYFYRVSVAAKRLNQEDRFLNLAMKAFRDRPYKEDPFLRALYWEMLQTLADYPFEPRIVEMLEDMGHRGETADRVEEYARTALDRGRQANADAAARWLLGRQSDSRFHPRYHGIIALAAFFDDDVEAFKRASADVTARPEKVQAALPSRRQPQFFAHADAELARLLRQMLPVMAEWGDDRIAQDRRQRWLRVIVAQSQQFVRDTEDTLARPQLLELYRLASKLLDDHPRGYAERVGEEEVPPLVIGTVRVEGRDLAEAEPDVVLEFRAPYSLVLVPRDELPPAQWPTRWPEEEL